VQQLNSVHLPFVDVWLTNSSRLILASFSDEMEYDKVCAEKFKAQLNGHVYPGDQGDVATLRRVISESGGNFDVVVDDGGQKYLHMKHTFEQFFPDILKPGGLFFLEDLQASRMGPGGQVPDTRRGPFNQDGVMMEDLRRWMRGVVLGEASSAPGVDMIEHMNCFIELCVFRKMPARNIQKSAVFVRKLPIALPAASVSKSSRSVFTGTSSLTSASLKVFDGDRYDVNDTIVSFPFSLKSALKLSPFTHDIILPLSNVTSSVLPKPLMLNRHHHTQWIKLNPVLPPLQWTKQDERPCSLWFKQLGSNPNGAWGRTLTGQWNAKSHRTSISKRVFYREQTPDATAKAFSSRVSPSSSAPRPPTALIIIGAAPVSEYSQRVSRFNTRRFAHIYGPNAFIILVEATANKLMPSDYPEVDVFSR
jgi:hypothetical protein